MDAASGSPGASVCAVAVAPKVSARMPAHNPTNTDAATANGGLIGTREELDFIILTRLVEHAVVTDAAKYRTLVT